LNKVSIRFIKESPDHVFKSGYVGLVNEDAAALTVKEGYAEYVNQNTTTKTTNNGSSSTKQIYHETNIEQLKITAQEYHNLGMAVIPFFINPQAVLGVHDKHPVIGKYAEWNNRPQTEEEFKALDWTKCNGFGVILGQKTKDGRYLVAVDLDPKQKQTKKVKVGDKNIEVPITSEDVEAHKKAVKVGEAILDDMPITKIEGTVNYGKHKFYWSKIHTDIDATFHDETATELLGDKKLCVMYPSYGYSNIGSDLIAEVEDIGELYREKLKKYGCCKSETTEVEHQVNKFSFDISQLIDLTQLENKGNGQYQGAHPIHDSSTEHNFAVDTIHNQWHCFRHNSGGGTLQYLAMKEGIIDCEQAKEGALRGNKFKKVVQLAVSSGYLTEDVIGQSEINPIILAKDIMEDYKFVVDKEADELYYYIKDGVDEGIYSNKTEQLIRREIVSRLDENFKAHYKNEITEFILGIAPLVEIGLANPDLLAVKNGLLDLRNKTLEKHSDKNYIINKLPVDFKPTESQVWQEFVNQVLPTKTQQEQVQQLIGHCLYNKIITETALILLGGGSNGKTIFLQTLTKFFGGAKNVGSHSIQALCYDKFITGEIKGKLANICADLPHKELMNTANFKALTSGDSVQAYVKHVQKTISFLPTTKYIFSANQIPAVANEEDCYAWYRRFIFADFTVTFTKENSIPRQELLNKLSTPECFSEILNWSLKGLETLFKEGDVTNKPTVAQVRLQYIRRSDSALAYFADKVKCTSDPADWVATETFFRDYVTYCLKHDLKPKTQGDFINTVKQHLPGAEKTRIRPEYDPQVERKPNPLSAFRYIKIIDCVSGVSDVSTFKNKSAELENISQHKLTDEYTKKADTPDTPDTESYSHEDDEADPDYDNRDEDQRGED
jgi:P4 family phage/plasmid primase-like protien